MSEIVGGYVMGLATTVTGSASFPYASDPFKLSIILSRAAAIGMTAMMCAPRPPARTIMMAAARCWD
jgi:hypothetical protein